MFRPPLFSSKYYLSIFRFIQSKRWTIQILQAVTLRECRIPNSRMGQEMAGDSAQILADRMTEKLPAPVERIETHGAIILLSGSRAFKIKRPVHFSFMDFSTPAARCAALAHELELNRRTAPEIYRRLVSVAVDGTLDSARATEYALEMARFDNAGRLDRVLERGEVGESLLDNLAAQIADFHQALPPLAKPEQASAMAHIIQGNRQDLSQSVGTVFEPRMVEKLVAATREEFERTQEMLNARQSWVRHCHGDLHSENIVIINGRPVLFDCIEFNDEFAQIDTLYDLAFLVMDLRERGYVDQSWRIMQSCFDLLPQDEGLALWPFFMSVRAAIRAKVEAFAGHVQKARRYLRFAQVSVQPGTPVMIAIGGLSGTGKTTLARALAPELDAFHLRSDVQRKQLFGKVPLAKLPQEAYAPDVSEHVFRQLNERAKTLLGAGRCVIVDGVFAKCHQRLTVEQAAHELNVPFYGIWLETSLVERQHRVDLRDGDASDADAQVAQAQEAYELGKIDWRRTDASGDMGAIRQRAGVDKWISHLARNNSS